MRRQMSLQYKETIKANVDATKRNHEDKVRREVENLKHEKREQKDFMHVLRHQEQIKNHQLKQMIKGQQRDAQDKRQRDFVERQMRAKAQIEDKMLREEHKRLEH